MRWWAYLFWIWAIVSLVIFVVRRMNARQAITEGPDIESGNGLVRASGGEPVAPAEKVWPAPPPPEPGDDTYRLDPVEAIDPPTRSGDDSTDVGDLPSSPGVATPAKSSIPVTTTLPELLSGITMPHELVPLTSANVSIDLATHIVLATRKANAETVRTGLCDELERLGYEVEHDTMLQLRAVGSRGVVRVELHPDGSTVHDGGVRRFPTAAEGSVVVELRAG